MASLMYARPELVKLATNLYQKADKNDRLAHRWHKKDYDRPVCFSNISRVGDYVFLDRPLISRSATERTSAEG